MDISQNGLIEIASYEGICLRPYREMLSTGHWDVWTFGAGHTADAGDPDPATLPMDKDQTIKFVFDLLRLDMRGVVERVNQALRVSVSQTQFDALCSFDYNTGGIFRAHLTVYLNEGNLSAAADAFMGWSQPPEIIGRRTKEMNLFRAGTYSSGGKALLFPVDALNRPLYKSAQMVDVAALLQAGDANAA